jgi:phosphatidylglycerophosphatase A
VRAVLDGAPASLYGTLVRALAIVVATVAGVGYAPVASGTLGSLVALPLLPPLAELRGWSIGLYATLLAVLVLLAVWAAGRAEAAFGGRDHSRIVIDEVVGLFVAGAFLPGTWSAAALAFFFFRAFDVLKPFPAGYIDGQVEGGLGVVGDDLVAGVYAGVASRVVLGFL